MLLLLIACTGDPKESAGTTGSTDSGTGDTGDDPCDVVDGATGTISVSFQMEEDYIAVMDEPPVGTFRGSLYRCLDATAIGPVEGAVSVVDITVEGVDLSGASGDPVGGPTGALWTSDALPAEKLWLLGCLDSDGNDCDYNDPITLPNENRVTVTPDTETPFTVDMGALNPS